MSAALLQRAYWIAMSALSAADREIAFAARDVIRQWRRHRVLRPCDVEALDLAVTIFERREEQFVKINRALTKAWLRVRAGTSS